MVVKTIYDRNESIPHFMVNIFQIKEYYNLQ